MLQRSDFLYSGQAFVVFKPSSLSPKVMLSVSIKWDVPRANFVINKIILYQKQHVCFFQMRTDSLLDLFNKITAAWLPLWKIIIDLLFKQKHIIIKIHRPTLVFINVIEIRVRSTCFVFSTVEVLWSKTSLLSMELVIIPCCSFGFL